VLPKPYKTDLKFFRPILEKELEEILHKKTPVARRVKLPGQVRGN
jgi:hypothetical protein